MAEVVTTRTIVQRLDEDGNVISETITTVEEKGEGVSEQFGLYL